MTKVPLEFIDKYINSKINANEEFIKYTFYELRIKSDLTEEETREFLELTKIKLENLQYQVYFTKDEYQYKGERKIVQDNELMVAIKEK